MNHVIIVIILRLSECQIIDTYDCLVHSVTTSQNLSSSILSQQTVIRQTIYIERKYPFYLKFPFLTKQLTASIRRFPPSPWQYLVHRPVHHSQSTGEMLASHSKLSTLLYD